MSKPKIIVSLELCHASGRDILSGVFRYLTTAHNWNLILRQSETNPLTEQFLDQTAEEGIAGIIITECFAPKTMRRLSSLPIPVVAVGIRSPELEKRRFPTAFIRNDNLQIGVLAAKHLVSAGKFNTYAFVNTFGNAEWIEERKAGFFQHLSKHGIPALSFKKPLRHNAEDNKTHLVDWLKTSEKPVAVMTPCDECSLHVLRACEKAGIRVPGQVSIIGVDNDETICPHATPPLSSVLPGHEQMGYEAAKALARLLRKPKPHTHLEKTISPRRVVARESSSPIPPSAVLVRNALEIARTSAKDGLSVEALAKTLGVSRRLIGLRFRELEGKTTFKVLEEKRMANAQILLKSTRRKIADIAASCGYPNAKYFSTRFLKLFGKTPREYRTKA